MENWGKLLTHTPATESWLEEISAMLNTTPSSNPSPESFDAQQFSLEFEAYDLHLKTLVEASRCTNLAQLSRNLCPVTIVLRLHQRNWF